MSDLLDNVKAELAGKAQAARSIIARVVRAQETAQRQAIAAGLRAGRAATDIPPCNGEYCAGSGLADVWNPERDCWEAREVLNFNRVAYTKGDTLRIAIVRDEYLCLEFDEQPDTQTLYDSPSRAGYFNPFVLSEN